MKIKPDATFGNSIMVDNVSSGWSQDYYNLSTSLPDNTTSSLHVDVHDFAAGVVTQVLAVAAILVNSSTIGVLCSQCGKLSCHLLFVLNQCVLDMTLAGYFVLEPFLLKVPLWLFVLLDEMTIVCCWLICLNLMLLTLDQLLVIARPLQYPRLVTRRRVKATLLGSYTLCALYFVMLFIGLAIKWTTSSSEEPGGAQDFWIWFTRSDLLWVLILRQYYVLGALIGLCVLEMFAVYGYLLYVVFRAGGEARVQMAAKARRKAVTVSFLVVLTFVVGTVIFAARVVLIKLHQTGGDIYGVLLHYTFPVLALNSLFDPLLYAVRLDKIREGYRQLWANMRCDNLLHNKTQQHTTSTMESQRL